MSNRKELRNIDEQISMVVTKAALQRSTFLMVAGPVFAVVRAAEVGVFAVKAGRAVVRHITH